MPIDPSISLQTKVPDGLTNLSTLVNTAGNLVALKKAQATFDPEVQAAQSQARILGANANVAEQTQTPRIAEQQAVTSQQQTAASKASYDFQNQKHIQAIQTLVGTANDPAVRDGDMNGILAALDRAQQNAIRYGADPKDIEQTFADYREMAKTNPKAVQPALLTALTQGLGGPQQAAVLTPSGPAFNTGQQQIQTTTNPFAAKAPGGIVAAVSNQIPVGSQAYDPNTGKPYLTGPGGGGIQNAPALGEAEQVHANQQEAQGIRAAADQVPVQRNINQAILRLSKDTTTAPGSHVWQQALAGISGGRVGSNYQEITKYLERNAIEAMKTMGGTGSNAQLEASMAATGSNQYNPETLQEITRFNDATNTALGKFRQGLDQAIGYQNQNIKAQPEFKANWAKNMDPDIFRIENAQRDNDGKELQAIKQRFIEQYGEKGAAVHMQELAQKRRNLESLSTTGQLPQ